MVVRLEVPDVPLTVEQVAALPDLGLIVRTSTAPVDRTVRWVAASELADPTPWLEPEIGRAHV